MKMSEVQLVKVEVEVPKEANEIRVALRELLIDIRKKKPAQNVVMENLQHLYQAVEGADKLDDEARSKQIDYVAGLMAADIASVLRAPADQLVEA